MLIPGDLYKIEWKSAGIYTPELLILFALNEERDRRKGVDPVLKVIDYISPGCIVLFLGEILDTEPTLTTARTYIKVLYGEKVGWIGWIRHNLIHLTLTDLNGVETNFSAR